MTVLERAFHSPVLALTLVTLLAGACGGHSGAHPAAQQHAAGGAVTNAAAPSPSSEPAGGTSRADAAQTTSLKPAAAGQAANQQSAGAPYLQRVELITDQANGAGDGNGWGGNISRIVRTSTGDIYTTFITNGSDYYHRPWYIAHRSADTGQWQNYTASGSAGVNVYNPPNILRGPDDTISVISWPNDQPYYWSSATSTDTPIAGNWYLNPTTPTGTLESAYAAAGIAGDGTIVLTQSAAGCNNCDHENTPGNLNWAYLPPGSAQWSFHTYSQDVRYAYMFLFPGGSHDLQMVGSADLRWAELGFQKPTDSTINYAFDGVRSFSFSNIDSPPSSSTLVRQESQQPGCLTVRTYASDVYQDTNGDVHVLYDFLGPDTNCQFTGRQAILHNGQVVKDVSLGIPYSNLARVIQDSTGRFYVFSLGPASGGGSACTLYLQRGADADTDGTNLEPQMQLPLNTSDDCSSIQNNFIAAPRSGTGLADYVDGVFAANSGSHWVYYRLVLRKDS